MIMECKRTGKKFPVLFPRGMCPVVFYQTEKVGLYYHATIVRVDNRRGIIWNREYRGETGIGLTIDRSVAMLRQRLTEAEYTYAVREEVK